MPRLLPRLLQNLTKDPLEFGQSRLVAKPIRKRRREQPEKALLRPSFLPDGRSQSILRDVDNPIANPARYTWHKGRSPRVRVLQREHESGSHNHPRAMDAQERDWWASPYRTFSQQHSRLATNNPTCLKQVRMLSSPVRICCLTGRYFPSGEKCEEFL